MSAIPSEAEIQLILLEGAANDPKATFPAQENTWAKTV